MKRLFVSTRKPIAQGARPPFLYPEYMVLLSDSIGHIVNRWPDHFESDLAQEFHRFAGYLNQAFRHPRNIAHLTKLFCSHYLMRKSLNRALYFSPQMRKVETRLIHAKLQFPFRAQPVLGVAIALSLNEETERLGERHIISAILSILPKAEIVKGSFCVYPSADPIRTFYLEISAEEGSRISLPERNLLKSSIADELTKRIEEFGLVTFNLHREEEVLKNVALLKRELASIPDLPQTMIFFGSQDLHSLSFHVILVRTVNKHTLPLAESFAAQPLQFILRHTKKLRNVETNVFELRIPIDSRFRRTDLSINLPQARYEALFAIRKALGNVRDYNGGLFAQQRDLLSEFKKSFPEIENKDPDLLDKFFHAISPSHMQALLHIDLLKNLFKMFLEALEIKFSKKEDSFFQSHLSERVILVMLRADDPSFKETIQEALKSEQAIDDDLITVSLAHRGSHFLGYISHSADTPPKLQFRRIVETGMQAWKKKVSNFQSLRLSLPTISLSLDPRIGGDEHSRRVLRLLFEGLTRIGKDGFPEPALAEKIEISEDKKTYCFTLRTSFWNNGDKVTAHDFAYAWKKVLSPSFSSAFAHLFYPIKNAKAIKEAKIGIEDIGIKVLDENTLKVELEHPCPYFLELTAHSLYSPVHSRIDALCPHWASQDGELYICNGPFQLKKNHAEECYELIKNRFYWDLPQIKLDRILIVQANVPTAFQLFKNGQIDWLGRPLQSWNPLFEKASAAPCENISRLCCFMGRFQYTLFSFQSTQGSTSFCCRDSASKSCRNDRLSGSRSV